ncbi:hypothetical protein ATANTOWER_010118 [Ataeniobius toweri]|uniref:Uncharacterized protein n=1 Tax=Ataeniobius toweri TaxID=208326 RepID=A0ABU7BNU7_9TELE|nr:hypothetical protein [Ataeniobius toweri]
MSVILGARGILTTLGHYAVLVTVSQSEPPLAKKRRVVPSAGGGKALFQAKVPQSAQVQRQGDEPGAQSPAINPTI